MRWGIPKSLSASPFRAVKNFVAKQFANAGTMYNTGNWGTIVGATSQFAVNEGGNLAETAKDLAQYFVGNGASVSATVGSLAFFYSGRNYDRAWAGGFPPDAKKNNVGHLWSAIGAGFLANGLVALSKTPLSLGAAVTSGVLHVGGKLGSLVDSRHDAVFKLLPLASRVPATASLIGDIHANFSMHPPGQAALHSFLPAALILCNGVWGKADLSLMPDGRVKDTLTKPISQLLPSRTLG